MDTIKSDLIRRVEQFVASDESNHLHLTNRMRIYDAPLLGVASAADPLFTEYQKPGVIAPHFMTPEQWLPGAKSVISYFLPFTAALCDSNEGAGLPSMEWIRARVEGEACNDRVREFIMAFLQEHGAQAVAPVIDPRFADIRRISNWSERHIAYAAGLGTFGLHRGLITPKGVAGRFGSVVTTLELEPTKRVYTGLHDSCLFYAKGTCGACIKRCPPHAITEKGKDNTVCGDYIQTDVVPYFPFPGGCGKCYAKVPCRSKNPVDPKQVFVP